MKLTKVYVLLDKFFTSKLNPALPIFLLGCLLFSIAFGYANLAVKWLWVFGALYSFLYAFYFYLKHKLVKLGPEQQAQNKKWMSWKSSSGFLSSLIALFDFLK